MTKEYAAEWTWDAHTHGGYGPAAPTPEKAIEALGIHHYKPHLGDCIVVRNVGETEDDWKWYGE